MLAAERIHGDDTTVPVLATGKTVTGRLWTYVRDDRPFGGPSRPAAMFYFSRDRRGEHPNRHLAGYGGILQADAYAGFGELYSQARKPCALTQALCWAHGRRNFFKLAELAKAPLAIEAVRRIDAIFDLERTINGLPHEQRHMTRQDNIAPLVADLESWMRGARGLPRRRGRMTRLEDRQILVRDIEQACADGARLAPACALAGIDARTLRRWKAGDGLRQGDRRPDAARSVPSHALSEAERARITAVANESRFADTPPARIVPALADEGIYIASESSFHRVLRAMVR